MQIIHCDQDFFTHTFIRKLETIKSSCSVLLPFISLMFALTYTMFLLYALYYSYKGTCNAEKFGENPISLLNDF